MSLQKVYAEISLGALSDNLEVVRTKAGSSRIAAVVKADAYGHGALKVAERLINSGAYALGVACTAEAIELREAGIRAPILVFFDWDNINECFRYNLTPVVFDIHTAEQLSAEARRRGEQKKVHVKIDTGMGRTGFTMPGAVKAICAIAGLGNIEIQGLMSHFADADLQDKDFAKFQLRQFRKAADELRAGPLQVEFLHMANSAATLTLPDAHMDMVRPGIMLYGYSCCSNQDLRPVMTIKSRIALIKKVPRGTSISYGRTFITERESTIATIPAGYADGYNRLLSNRGEVLINGCRAPVAGRVCMDTTMVDVTDVADVTYDSEVVLMGKQGDEAITADEIASRTGTIAYEVLTSVGKRVKRVYIDQDVQV